MVKIIFLNVITTFYRLFEWLKVCFRYYLRDCKFIWVDFLLILQYLWKNPHRISRDFLRQRGDKNVYAFGETPLTTLDTIAKECRLLSKDVFYELGCGSGRTCFWMQTFIKCQVVGVDYLPSFIRKAQNVKRWVGLSKIQFIQEDMLRLDYKNATAIYLYGTCLEDSVIERLVSHFENLKPKTKVITVSYPLSDYDSRLFRVVKSFEGSFPWGKAEIFLNERL